jgi:peptide/nickel transport system ATP-binding protein
VIDVSFRVRRGTTLALVGESGSGKSSLGRALVGLTPIAHGRVLFDGTEPLARNPRGDKAFHRDVAMMFQDPVSSLSPRRTVEALITEPFVVHGPGGRDLKAEARRLLKLVGLPQDFLGRYPHQLSGGQARRVGVARAVALSPKLIVADEPTAGLDVSVQGEILNLMVRLQRELGITYIIITHNLAVVRHVSDETAIMYMGRFVEQGPTAEIFASASHPYTAALIASQPPPDPDLRREDVPLFGEVPSLARRPSGCEFHTRCRYAQEKCRIDRPMTDARAPSHFYRCHYPLAD